ncbi:MAG: tetratricopeptide repeat protein [Planctomycetota bacterium]
MVREVGCSHLWVRRRANSRAAFETLAAEATAIFRRQLGPSPELADSLNVLGNALQRQNKLAEAIPAHEESLAMRRAMWPPGHPRYEEVATALHNLGIAHYYAGDVEEATDCYTQAIEIEEPHAKPNDPQLATSKQVLSIVYANQSQFERAERWQREAFAARSQAFGPDHDHVGLSCNWLGIILQGQRKYDESLPLLQRAIAIHTEVYGEDAELTIWDQECLLRTLVPLGQTEQARSLFEAGDVAAAQRSQQQAIDALPPESYRADEFQHALDRYQAVSNPLDG